MARTLLIVDDHRGLDVALGHVLARDGWDDVVQADTTARALALVNRRRPDLVMTELRVGTEDGMDLLRAL
ncbi:MAG TPA: response regulator, partial [Aquihabitans sp.]|nr:response regulator [Aquihabitans sp.]